jgi:hypothetical protein
MADQTQPAPTVSWSASQVPQAWATVQVPVVDQASYKILREVARGGVGRILEAVDARLQREVALKQLLVRGADEARFIREAVLTARLQHPSIVPIHEVGVFTNGEPFIAMKLVRGESLRSAIRKAPGFAERLELLPAVLQVAEAVAYAHSQRVIHRDLKPANVLLGSFGEVVVIDWGLAKHLDVADEAGPPSNPLPTAESTAVGAIVGTPAYMPPEQALARGVDERADVYSLGAILYEVLTGQLPFPGESADEVLQSLLTQRPVPVEQRVPEVSPDLAAIVRRAMMPDRNARYASAADFSADLRRYQLGQRVTAFDTQAYDSAMEAAFTDELNDRTAAAMRVLGPFASASIAAFAIFPRLHHGAWVARDLWPRGLTVLGLILISAAMWVRRLERYSQHFGMAMILLLSVFFVAVNVVEHNVMGWFTASTIAAFLGCAAMLPLRPHRALVLAALVSASAPLEGILSRMSPSSVQFLLQTNLIAACGLITYIGTLVTFRIRRAEFHNRYRLRQANERLARFDRR